MGIVLYKSPHTSQPSQRSACIISVDNSEFCHPNRKFLVTAITRVEKKQTPGQSIGLGPVSSMWFCRWSEISQSLLLYVFGEIKHCRAEFAIMVRKQASPNLIGEESIRLTDKVYGACAQ